MAKATLNDILDSINPEINKILSTDYREILDKRITILDLSYEALKVNVYRSTATHIEAYNSAYKTLVEVLNDKATRQYASLADIPDNYFDRPGAPFLYINGGDNNRFLVAQSFEAIRNFVTNNISRDPRLVKTSFGQSTIYKEKLNKAGVPSGDVIKGTRTKVDIGHVASADSEQLVSPLELKISKILELGKVTNNTIIIDQAQKALSDLYAIQANVQYNFKNTVPEAISLANSKLGSLYVVVTLHRQKLNKAFSQKELQIFNKLKASIALKLSKTKLHNISGSNTIVEDIVEHLRNSISGNKKKVATHNPHAITAKPININGKVITESKNIKVNKPSPIRNVDTGQFYSLTALQTLINTHLQDVVAANMGDGSRKDILNYRTGRFASSVKLERMTLSREGMITAFYSFMKNPYATFSQGGRQSIPTSRDPKLLIAKSIREIAAEKVANRMRSVSV